MTPPGQANELVTVIEHPSFINLYEQELEQEGLPIAVEDVDKVFKQVPSSGAMKKGHSSTLILYVSEGPTLSKLPDMVGKALADVRAAANKAGLSVNVASQAFDETAPADQVLSFTVKGQQVSAGDQVTRGTPIDVVTSKGAQPRVIPPIAGKPFADVQAQLTQMGLVVQQAEDIFSDKYPAGTVAHLEPVGQGATLQKGGTLVINVSKGPDVVVVPNVYGQSAIDAKTNLEAAGLTQGTITGPVDKKVIGLSPDKDAVVKRGTAVNIKMG